MYRKWRPDRFEDVKGQDPIVTTLKNQILMDRIGHAYLFCGTRGTGKTTVAKIFAKAVNCAQPTAGGSPCGECAVCKAIADGSSLNVIEIDAASNNGVDNIRQIREEVAYRPTEGKYKVYIIDEVHMLSIGAFNALLKTLEEPPAYVIFILATTEVHKIPVTILSRCQRYDFKRIGVDTIKERLVELVTAEEIDVEEKALRYIAKKADGAMRDALSLLDQCVAFYIGQTLRYEDVLEVLGAVDTEVFSALLLDVINGKTSALIRKLDDLILQGRDLSRLVADFTWYIRNLLMLKASPESENMLDMSAENMQHLKEEAFMVEEETLMRYIRILSELSADLRNATQKRIGVEVALIKMMKPQMENDLDSVTERLRRLEELVKEKEDLIALTAIRPAIALAGGSDEKPPVKSVQKQELKALPEDLFKVAENWKGIIGAADPMYQNFLKAVRITAEGETLLMVAENSFIYEFLNRGEHLKEIKQTIERTIGKSVAVETRLLEEGTVFEDAFTDVTEYVKMNIAIED